jgi:hypothetical protein
LRDLGNAAYGRAVELLVDTLEGIAPVSDTAETNVGEKLQHWKEELRKLRDKMAKTLEEVGGEAGRALAAEVRSKNVDDEQDKSGAQWLIDFAGSAAFQAVLDGLADNVAARVRLQGLAGSMGDKANQVAQLMEVPDWARAGASHSQTAKDHDDSAFHGIAFTVARQADLLILTALEEAWTLAGWVGPAAGLEGNYQRDAEGEVVGEGLSDFEKARRKAFLETRDAGEQVLEHGHAETMDVGPRLVAIADGLEAIIEHHPILDPVLSGLVWLMRQSPDGEELLAELEVTRVHWEEAARSGELDDATIAAVDTAIGQVSRLAGVTARDEHGGEHPFDPHHPREDEDHEHGARTEVFFESQIRALDEHRGRNAMRRGEVRQAIELNEFGTGPVEDVDVLSEPRDRMFAEIDRIFGHPYDSNWWTPTVHAWCTAHQDLLERAIHDRNQGVMHSHVH